AHLAWLDAVLARPPELLGPALRANVLLARGRALLARARFDHSLPSNTEARALIGIGIAHHRSDRDDEARGPFERALELLRGYDLRRESVVHGYLGAIEQQAGRMHAARS